MKLNYFNAALRICVDRAGEGIFRGRVYGRRLERPLAFQDMSDLLLQIDSLLDDQDFPRAYQRKRSFEEASPPGRPMLSGATGRLMDEAEVENSRGELCSFTINILTRQDVTWQGVLDWLDGRPPQTFKSELELIRFINQRLKIIM